ncbi:MAG: hypothetical protein IT319_14915, partial [Anaerolineae bacterium]|nr:hypothetical protein [Anaerolineae bacterium]
MTGTIVIKKDREKPIRNQHPWIFSGAIDEVRGNPTPGDIVTVVSHSGTFLARGYWNPTSQIQVRILTWRDEEINEDWWRQALKRAVDARVLENWRQRHQSDPYGFRIINAENDYIPGIIVDRYGGWLVLQALTLHIDQQKTAITHLLADIYAEMGIPIKGVYERSDVDIRKKEGLEQSEGLLYGEEPPKLIPMAQEKLIRLVDVRKGHKTGYYLDQLRNQDFLAKFLDSVGLIGEARILNLFSYTGGFGLSSGGSVVNVDASREVL